jgi:hypothetical protein
MTTTKIRRKNAVCIHCGEWKALWHAKCQSCMRLPDQDDDGRSLFLSLDRPGISSTRSQWRAELRRYSEEIKAGHGAKVPEGELRRMNEILETWRSKRCGCKRRLADRTS